MVTLRVEADGAATLDGAAADPLEPALRALLGEPGARLRLETTAERLADELDRLRRLGFAEVIVVAPVPAALGGGAPLAAAPASTGDAAVADVAPPPPAPLPEVTVRNVGLHIGGGPNDDATKKQFREALGARMDDFRACYRLVARPSEGGVFGADLYIMREGGFPEIRDHRTGMGGVEFRQCVLDVFASTTFAPPTTGPTVISYSLRFSVEGR